MLPETQLSARLIEIFSAIQGEGLNVGTRQLFIRFALCDLRCHFCDSANTWSVPKDCRIEQTPGHRDFETHSNPVPASLLLNWVERQNRPGLHDSISLTGGEPLLHAPFLVEFLPQLRQLTLLPIYLESGGHRPQQLARVLPYLDLVGMDIKLPSVSGEDRWLSHAEFLHLCDQASVEVFVKLIIDRNTNPVELQKAAHLVADVNPKIPVFLQPVTPVAASKYPVLPPSPEQVLAWQTLMKDTLKQVRVIPQTHKMIGQL
ncbi:radical SAM protein [Lyngbya aestuarii]|uniref:radical SAM protein n=1 Tax=Lyngbya aestuarii TaxID=118322 RepID=UPI00403DF2AF